MLMLIGIGLFLFECWLLLTITSIGLLMFFPIIFIGCGCFAFDEEFSNDLF